jgi:hypothetical protein
MGLSLYCSILGGGVAAVAGSKPEAECKTNSSSLQDFALTAGAGGTVVLWIPHAGTLATNAGADSEASDSLAAICGCAVVSVLFDMASENCREGNLRSIRDEPLCT